MSFEYVRADVLKNVQRRVIESYGGLQGVRDEGGLESAIARPRNLHEYGEIESPGALAAALAWAVVRNHPFVDGNKRAAFAGLQIFVTINGFTLDCSEVEETAMMLGIASGQIMEEQWTAWVEEKIRKL